MSDNDTPTLGTIRHTAGIGAVVGTYASHTLARWADSRKAAR